MHIEWKDFKEGLPPPKRFKKGRSCAPMTMIVQAAAARFSASVSRA
jgi:hypothetical protein